MGGRPADRGRRVRLAGRQDRPGAEPAEPAGPGARPGRRPALHRGHGGRAGHPRRSSRGGWWALLAARELLLGVVLLVLRRHGYGPLQVSFVGKAATAGPALRVPAAVPGRARRPATPRWPGSPVGPSLSGERALYWCAALLYVEQARRLLAAGAAPAGCRRDGGAPQDGCRRSSGTKGGWAAVKAVVMAGGEGTRLRPMTANQPKPHAAGGQQADHGARAAAAAQARLRRDRRHRAVPRLDGAQLLRRRRGLRHDACSTPPRRPRWAPRAA